MKNGTIEIITLEPDEGMVLTNGETFSDKVYLGKNDDPSNWWEVPDEGQLNPQEEIEES